MGNCRRRACDDETHGIVLKYPRVAAIAFWRFYSGKNFSWQIFLPLAVTAIPMAFIGGMTICKLLLQPIVGQYWYFRSFIRSNLPKFNSRPFTKTCVKVAVGCGRFDTLVCCQVAVSVSGGVF